MKSRAAGLLLAALATASAGLAGGPAARAATQPICVGVVVDFADLGGGTDASCAKVPAGSSGSEVLTAAGHRVTFDPRYGDDFVCAIDGEPAGGCDSVDSSHFWAYYHRAPGSTAWHYSAEGPGTYEPADGSSEGWIYNDGQDPPPVPPDVGYRSMCPQTASPAPSPTPTHRQTADRSGTSTTGGQQLQASATPTSTCPPRWPTRCPATGCRPRR